LKKVKMSTNQRSEELRLRPHHLFCERFLPWTFPERGEAFNDFERKIRKILRSGTSALIEVTEGADELCRVCPLCQNGRCQSPQGNEDEVRKWDAIVLKGLAISYGDRITTERLHAIINEKAPLTFCKTRCKAREYCGVFLGVNKTF